MKRTNTIIIGAGQAGLAMSRCLSDRAIDHVLLERGRVAERWRSERWDSARLLTPNWQSRLPGWSYRGDAPDGFMTMPEVTRYFEDYADSFGAPVEEATTVLSVVQADAGYRVETDRGDWTASNVVVATGHCDVPLIPAFHGALDSRIRQVVPSDYRNPDRLAPGGVLVVGASASGLQLAHELALSGRRVLLAVGRHTRLPRRYRGRDIMSWLDAMGILDDAVEDVRDVEASRRLPSFQLVGSDGCRTLDLGVLQHLGVGLLGRMVSALGSVAVFAEGLQQTVAEADIKQRQILERIDAFVDAEGLGGEVGTAERPSDVRPRPAPTRLDLNLEGIDTVVWATGYGRSYPWLKLPVLDRRGEIRHAGGVTGMAGLYALGLRFLRHRNSSFIDGVGRDASALADHLARRLARGGAAAA